MKTAQPKPTGNGAEILPLVLADLHARDALGRKKYGTTLCAKNGRDPLRDAYEEALDMAMYLRQAIEERDGGETQPAESTPPLTPSQIALARMLDAYDAWAPCEADEETPWAEDTVDQIGEVLDRANLLEVDVDGVYGPNAEGRALLDRARRAGVL